MSVWEIFWPLSVGARLVIAQPGDHRDPERIISDSAAQVTTLNFMPSMLKAFLAYPDVKAKTRLKHIMCGGEAVPATLQQDVAECLDGAHRMTSMAPLKPPFMSLTGGVVMTLIARSHWAAY